MTVLFSPDILQLAAWSLGLLDLILSFYIIIVNRYHVINRYTSGLFIIMAVNSFALGTMANATNEIEAAWATAYLAATTISMGFSVAFIAVILTKSSWVFGQARWPLVGAYIIWGLPIALTAIDLLFGTQIWYLGLPAGYTNGYLGLSEYTGHPVFRVTYLVGTPWLALIPLGYLAFFDKQLEQHYKGLARLLFAGEILALLLQGVLPPVLPQPLPTIMVNALFVLIYAHASFSQMVFEHRLQRGRIQVRLTLLTLAISAPLLAFTSFYITKQASTQIEKDSIKQIEQTAHSIATTSEIWLDLNTQALEQLVLQPAIVSMEPERQKPILEAMTTSHPHMYLVSTTDLTGLNVARSDDKAPKDYSDRQWYQKAIQGEALVFQTLIGRTSGEPALVVSKPIYAPDGEIIGVGMFAIDLNAISDEVVASGVGETGEVFVIDASNKVVAHTNPEYANQLLDFSTHPAVATMRNRDLANGTVHYTSPDGIVKFAYFQQIEHGWGIIVEQNEQERLAAFNILRVSTWGLTLAGIALLSLLMSLAIRQTMRPINSLTETANAIAEGDLHRVATIESEDEFGLLARTFNRMTEQLLEFINTLEQRVAERTQVIEKRSAQLVTATEIGRAASTMLDVNQLIQETVNLIRNRFDLYYVGLFLLDDNHEYAILRAGTGKAGEILLARGHKIRVGEGMVGWAITHNRSRVALDIHEDATHKHIDELSETRSEAALPLRSRGEVIGALTVQSLQPGTFDEDSIAVLQTMADLISAAIANARLHTETENALQAARRAYSELSRKDWMTLLQSRPKLTFRSDYSGTNPSTGNWTAEMKRAWAAGRAVTIPAEETEDGIPKLAIPIKVRGNVIGVIQANKSEDAHTWADDELAMLETVVEQIGLSLDSARLYSDTRLQAQREHTMQEMTDKLHRALDMDELLQTLLQEVSDTLGIESAFVQLNTPSVTSKTTSRQFAE